MGLGAKKPDYKFFICSTQLSMNFIMLKNVKIQTYAIIACILTLVSMTNIASESLIARKVYFFSILDFMSS